MLSSFKTMRQRFCVAPLLGLVLFLTAGCLENAMLVKVNPDGSGDITYRLFLSEPLLHALATQAEFGDMEEAEARRALFQQMIEGIGPQLGEGIERSRDSISSNARGWHGFEAVYAFDTIADVRLDSINPLGSDADQQDTPGASSIGGRYTFSFEPGAPAALGLHPIPDAPSGYPYDLDPTGPGDWQSLLGTDLSEELFRALDGLRITIYLAVSGEVQESNASFVSARVPNVFTLLDLPFDRIAAHPEAFALVQRTGPDIAAILAELSIPEVRIEEPGKIVRIEFQ